MDAGVVRAPGLLPNGARTSRSRYTRWRQRLREGLYYGRCYKLSMRVMLSRMRSISPGHPGATLCWNEHGRSFACAQDDVEGPDAVERPENAEGPEDAESAKGIAPTHRLRVAVFADRRRGSPNALW